VLSNKTIVLLAAVLLALLAALRHAGPLLGAGAGDGDAPGTALLSEAASRPTAVRLETPALSVALRRPGARWVFAPPASGRADSRRVDLAVETALQAVVRDRVTARQRESRGLGLEAFGLDAPRARLELEGPGWRTGVSIGGDTPDGSCVYALVDGRTDVAVVDRAALDLLPASVDDLRDRSVFAEPGREIESLEIRRPGAAVVRLERGADTLWRFSAPYACATDPANSATLLAALSGATVGRFVRVPGTNDPPDAATAAFAANGLSPEDAVLSLGVRVQGEPEPSEYAFGGADPASEHAVFAGDRTDGTVFTVDRAVLDALLMPVSLLRDRRPFPFAPREIRSVSFRTGDGPFAFGRADATADWTISEPSPQPASQAAAGAFLDRLLSLLDADAEPLPEGEAASLDSIRLDLAPAAPAEPLSAILSRRPAAAEGAPPDLLVSIPGGRIRHVVPGDSFPPDALSAAAFAALRDPVVLRLAPEDLRSLSRRAADGAVQTVRRGADGVWFRDAAEGGGAPDEGAVAAAAAAVCDLAAAETVALFTSDSAAYGLLPPKLELTVSVRDDAPRPVTILQLGTARPDGSVFLRVKGEDPVFAVSAETAAVLSAPLAK
jgi:hypothetical protein